MSKRTSIDLHIKLHIAPTQEAVTYSSQALFSHSAALSGLTSFRIVMVAHGAVAVSCVGVRKERNYE